MYWLPEYPDQLPSPFSSLLGSPGSGVPLFIFTLFFRPAHLNRVEIYIDPPCLRYTLLCFYVMVLLRSCTVRGTYFPDMILKNST